MVLAKCSLFATVDQSEERQSFIPRSELAIAINLAAKSLSEVFLYDLLIDAGKRSPLVRVTSQPSHHVASKSVVTFRRF